MKREHERPLAYEAPMVEVIEVMVEQGFAVSPPADYENGGTIT